MIKKIKILSNDLKVYFSNDRYEIYPNIFKMRGPRLGPGLGRAGGQGSGSGSELLGAVGSL